MGNLYVGSGRTGDFTQSGGSVSGSLEVGYTGTGRYPFNAGSLNSYTDDVGGSGTGILTQNSGVNNLQGFFIVGNNAGANGTCYLNGGTLTTNLNEVVGDSGAGPVTQTGGTNNGRMILFMGSNSGSTGTYNLSGGTLSVQVEEWVGTNGTGIFTQSGGLNNTGSVSIAEWAGSNRVVHPQRWNALGWQHHGRQWRHGYLYANQGGPKTAHSPSATTAVRAGPTT